MKHKLALLSLVLLSALPSSLAAHSSFHSPHLTSVFNTHVPPAKPYHVALSLPIPLEVYSSLVPGSVWSLITSQPAPLFLGALLITFVAVGALSAVLTGSKNQQLDAPKTFKEAVNKVEAFAKATPLATVAELAAFSKAAFQEAGVTLTPGDQEAFTVLLTDLVASKNVTPIPPGLMQDDVLNKLVKFSSATPLATVAELMTFSEEAFQEAGVTLTPRDREVFTSCLD